MEFMSGIPIPTTYSSSFASLDRDHALLIEILNELKASANASASTRNELRLRLLAYLDAHFEHEEDLMDEFQYSESAAHKASHREMREKAHAAIHLDSPAAISAYVSVLERWIEEHMCGIDRKLADFLSERQPSAHAQAETGAFE